MFFPRLITIFVFVLCASAASFLFTNNSFIPLEPLRWMAFAAMTLFAGSALIVLISMWGGMTKESSGNVTFTRSHLFGRLMGHVTRNRKPWDGDLHCCDVYIDTTKWLGFWSFCTAGTMVLIVGIYQNIISALIYALVLCCIVAFVFAVLWFSDKQQEKKCAQQSEGRTTVKNESKLKLWINGVRATSQYAKCMKLFEWVGIAFLGIWVLCMVFALLYSMIYLPITALIALGYTTLMAIGVYFLAVSMITFPAYCIAGKKLIQKTGKFGEIVCPVFRKQK